jgi:DNA polymerase
MTSDHIRAARELLAFYQEAGVDAFVGETPVNRLVAETAADRPAGERSSSAVKGPMQAPREGADAAQPRPAGAARNLDSGNHGVMPPSADAAVATARAAAKSAAGLEELRALLERFEGCGLRATATRLVFGDGNPRARVMFVGEAPGRDEDMEGRPFVGRSGKLLDLMMAAIGLDRTNAYIANIVPWRPPGNREPSAQESAVCLPFIRRQIELVDPDVLVCLGKPSATTLLDIKEGLLKVRGRWFDFHTGTRDIRATVTMHPAYLLRQPIQKRLAWRDFLAIKKALATT